MASGRARKKPIPPEWAPSQRTCEWFESKGHSDFDEHVEAFRAKALKGGLRYVDWDAAFQEAVRGDWAGLRKPNGAGADVWWASDVGIQRKGGELGLSPRPGESTASYRDRIRARIEAH